MSLKTRARIARWFDDMANERSDAEYLRSDLQARCDYANYTLRTHIKVSDLICSFKSPKYILPGRVTFSVEGIEFLVTRSHEGYDNLGGGVFCHLYLRQEYDDYSYVRYNYEVRSLVDLAAALDRVSA